ncbi:hypothetical protein OUZ56_000414 [Daphnia magna]|uniref:Pentatricopeptide repeat-containing protein 1, mitochondrial n=1 Tax=Daphnia magna TaxID=35525 RepID=A0ABQ9ZZR4_9CRUS|nr:hypothetical protein OUZ56_000414 [Daphnia magna]
MAYPRMTMRWSFLFGVSRTLTRQKNHIWLRYFSANAISHISSNKKEFVRKLSSKLNDPDVFGTLSLHGSRESQSLDSINNQELPVDEGDVEEEKHLSFQPADRKSVEEFEKEISQLIEKRKLKDALFCLEVTMKEDRIQPSIGVFSLLIGACGREGYSKKAFSLFNQMKKKGFDPKDCHYTALFNSCANSPWKVDGLQRAKILRQQLNDRNVLLNRAQYHAMIKAFGHCGEINTALQIVDEMVSNKLVVTTESFSFLLQACISLPEEGFARAVLVWRKLRNMRVTPSIFSYNLMLRTVRDCDAKDVNGQQNPIESVLLLEEKPDLQANSMLNQSILSTSELMIVTDQLTVRPNLLAEKIKSSNIMALTGLEKTENRLALLGGIEGFLEEMNKDHVRPDIKTFSLLLETIASNPKEEKVLMEQMKACGVIPDISFLNMFIKKRQFRQDYSGAQEILSYFQDYQLFPDIMTFGVLALGCRTLPEADSLMSDMENAGFRVNIEIFGCLLKNAIVRRNCFYIVDLLKRAVKMNLALDEKAVKLLDKFKRETSEAIAKHDRGLKVQKVYGERGFRESFKIFCLEYKPHMQKLELALEPHPWQQYRYNLSKERASDPPCPPLSKKTVQNKKRFI